MRDAQLDPLRFLKRFQDVPGSTSPPSPDDDDDDGGASSSGDDDDDGSGFATFDDDDDGDGGSSGGDDDDDDGGAFSASDDDDDDDGGAFSATDDDDDGASLPDPGPLGPHVIFAVDTSVRMEFDPHGNYYDLGLWPRNCADGAPAGDDDDDDAGSSDDDDDDGGFGDDDDDGVRLDQGPCGPAGDGDDDDDDGGSGGGDPLPVATSLGVPETATLYRRIYHGLIDPTPAFPIDAASISVVDDQNPAFSKFFAPTRLGMARRGLVQVVEENHRIVRFGLVRSRYGANYDTDPFAPTVGNESPIELTTAPQSDLPGDLGTKQWQITLARTIGSNNQAAGRGDEVLVRADDPAASAKTRGILLREPDEAYGLLPAGQGLDDSTDSPIDNLLLDTRVEIVRLMDADMAQYRECRNAAVVLVVGGSGGGSDPANVASTFAAVSGGGVTRRVPIIVVAVDPPAGDVPNLQAIADNSHGMYIEADDHQDVARAANYAVSLVHGRPDEIDGGAPSTYQMTTPVAGTVDLANASDINGVPLVNSVVTSASGAVISQASNVVVTAGFSLPGFEADLRAFRLYRPEHDATKLMGYSFVSDGTPLWKARPPAAASRNIFTFIPGTGMVPFTSDSAALLQPYLRATTVAKAVELIDFLRSQPLGAIINSTPAIMDPPSKAPPDAAYATFAAQRAGRRSLIFYGGNAGMLHAIDARLGVEVWGFIPFNLLPKLETLLDGQPTDAFDYFVDSSPKIADVKTAAGWRTVMVIGQGLGGTFYQAFDVSDAGMSVASDLDDEASVVASFATPTAIPFEWSFPSYSAFDHLIDTSLTPWGDIAASADGLEKTVGYTWSAPALGQVESSSGPFVAMTGSGYIGESVEAQANRGGVRAGTTS